MKRVPGASWAYVSLDFIRVVWARQINLGSLCIKFKALEIEELVREKGQSERTQLRPEPRATYAEKRGQQTVPRKETRKTFKETELTQTS